MCYLKKGTMVTSKWICIDSTEWLFNADQSLPFDLDCMYQGISAVKILQSILYYPFVINPSAWVNSVYSRPDCTDEVLRWSVYGVNLTYTIQKQCDDHVQRNPGLQQGLRCIITKYFLRHDIFNINRYLLQTRGDIYPYAFGLNIIYTCV